MLDGVTLNGSEVRTIIAKFLGVPVSSVVPMRFNYVVNGLTSEEIKEKLGQEKE